MGIKDDGKVSSQIKLERAKLQGRPFKEKYAYVVEYYRIHIFAGILAIVLVLYTLNALVWNPAPKPYLFITVNGDYVSYEVFQGMAEELDEIFVPAGENLTFTFDNFYSTPEDPTMDYNNMQKFAAMIAARQIDIIIFKNDQMAQLAGEGILMPLTEYFTEVEITSMGSLVQHGALIDYHTETGAPIVGQPEPVGVALTGNEFFVKHGVSGISERYSIGLVVNTEKKELATEFLKDLFEMK